MSKRGHGRCVPPRDRKVHLETEIKVRKERHAQKNEQHVDLKNCS